MYRVNNGQITIFENPGCFIGAKLNPENRWVQLAKIVPWILIEEQYKESFKDPNNGRPAKPVRMALGSQIIKEKFVLSDEETVELIRENPYLQYFIGLDEFTDQVPFDTSTMTWFRKRLKPEMIAQVNDYITGRKTVSDKPEKKNSNDDNEDDGNIGGGGSSTVAKQDASKGGQTKPENKGTLIVDATCAPSDIRFPTDGSLLNEAREKLEEMIDTLHENQIEEKKKKPRTYRRKAHKEYMRFVRNRKPAKKAIRKAVKQQLGYVGRDLRTIAAYGTEGLSDKQLKQLLTIQTLHKQQKEMYKAEKHTVEDRIVSISQPWVRPIVRGKTNAAVEFGAKISISMVDGFATIEKLDWNAYNESTTLIETIERFKEQTGSYPQRVLADKIYRTRKNLDYCKINGIHLSGPKLGRPPEDKALYREQCRQERMEAGERNVVEGEFGNGKRRYNLDRIIMRLQETCETQIHMIFLSINLWKRLRVFLYRFFSWLMMAFQEATETKYFLIVGVVR